MNQTNNCCHHCPNRRVGCHNEATCSKWAEHEANKRKRYSDHEKNSTISAIEREHIRKTYRKFDMDRKRKR